MDVGHPLPLFPLGTVLFPDMPLSLMIFEDRYMELVADLLQRPKQERAFGVVAIRDGYEVGDLAVHSAHRVGCEALVHDIERRRDGRFELEVVGKRRFRVDGMDEQQAYLTGDVEWFDEPDGADVGEACAQALSAFEAYRCRLSDIRGAHVEVTELPTQPRTLSYALAAGGLFMLADRQARLEEPDVTSRLARLATLLRSETAAMSALPSLPATDVVRTGWSPN
ncbi:LON peptidase substrate-binding domain-containing protein [soil metagenome]